MSHYFISTYFNLNDCQIRKKLALEFSQRYPNVILLMPFWQELEVSNKITYDIERRNGFIDYILINKFISSKNDIESLTLIDSDLILPIDFFEKIINKISNFKNSLAIQNFERCYELKDSKFISANISSMFHYIHDLGIEAKGLSGYSWTFNKKFLIDINYKFPECFLIGGFDYILSLSLQSYSGTLKKMFEDSPIEKEVKEFYNKLIYSSMGYLEVEIIHNFHGQQKDRLTKWQLYKEPLTQELIDSFFDVLQNKLELK